MKLKKGEYIISIEGCEIDLYDLVHNELELNYVTKIRDSLFSEGLFKEAQAGEVDILSIAAIIVYIDELSVLMDVSDANNKIH